ncbi:uncharacterized protein AFUA_3G00460 [Aspergillus fumigatus Af293]|uniref:Uncharacterized protein n=1 Tax=Aspergillus fumigatus (strain ATCC MYA-4609 / CBS 101355 / FGSC A1100 / Af293) TaxID=330879 RepID=Q4WFZ9_ASPFU|nr:hypothetical protein AFUA_3G00460 [Aspergillus fumigatus Af293]EAL86328.1 hypothetical protein AFUA_3G00460 [Aspergillus fumigatus Af293]
MIHEKQYGKPRTVDHSNKFWIRVLTALVLQLSDQQLVTELLLLVCGYAQYWRSDQCGLLLQFHTCSDAALPPSLLPTPSEACYAPRIHHAMKVRTIVSCVSPSAQDIVFIREWLALAKPLPHSGASDSIWHRYNPYAIAKRCLFKTAVAFSERCSDLQSSPERPHIILGFWSITPCLHGRAADRQLGHFYNWR